MAAAFLAPARFVFLSWKIVANPTGCYASATDLVWSAWHAVETGVTFAEVTPTVVANAVAYITTYKVPLSAFSAAILLVTLGIARLRWIAIAFFVYAVVYLSAQYASLLRLRWRRLVDGALSAGRAAPDAWVAGLVLAAVLAARWAIGILSGRSGDPQASPDLADRDRALALAVIGGWQARRLARQMSPEVAERTDATSVDRMALLRVISAEAASLIRLAEARGMREPRVILVRQDEAELEWNVARLLSVNVSGHGSLYHYRLEPGWIWRSEPDPRRVIATRVVATNAAAAALLRADVIWLLGLDDWLRNALKPIVISPACLARPEGFFLFKNAAGTGFDCVAKMPAG